MLNILRVSLRTKRFVMVLGRGDTDMAALPRAFAERMGAKDRYLEIKVPMDWMDSSDLFGHLDLEGKFIPGAIIDFLKQAQSDPEKPYFLCLDGIQLSRAEYYLREVLTAIERKTPLVPVIYYGRDQEALKTYGEIPALENLYIIGTSNLDYASLPLNQKLLDRVPTIYLQPGDALGQGTAGSLQCEYDNIGDCLEKAQVYFPLFEQLNQILIRINSYVGYQMRNDGILFLLNNDVLEPKVAEDHIICQKVLTRIQGAQKVKPALEELLTVCRGAYPRATAALERMLRQLETEDYTSYWG